MNCNRNREVCKESFSVKHQRGADTFQYSAQGEILSVTAGTSTISYAYDGMKRRVGRTDAVGATQYLYGNPGNPFLVTEVRDSNDELTTFYYDEQELLFAFNRGGNMYYIATDQVGTPHVITDSSGAIVKIMEYDSFGVYLAIAIQHLICHSVLRAVLQIQQPNSFALVTVITTWRQDAGLLVTLFSMVVVRLIYTNMLATNLLAKGTLLGCGVLVLLFIGAMAPEQNCAALVANVQIALKLGLV